MGESNSRQPIYKNGALPTELTRPVRDAGPLWRAWPEEENRLPGNGLFGADGDVG